MRGQCWLYETGHTKSKNITCLLATSQHGPELCLFLTDSCDSVVYTAFVAHLIANHPDYAQADHKLRPLLVWDNVPFHWNKLLLHLLKHTGAEVLTTPAYSPMINMVEFVNRHLKKKVEGWRASNS